MVYFGPVISLWPNIEELAITKRRKLDNNWFWKVLLRTLLEEANVLNTDLRVAIISFYESWKGLKLRIGIDQTQIQTIEEKNIRIRRK